MKLTLGKFSAAYGLNTNGRRSFAACWIGKRRWTLVWEPASGFYAYDSGSRKWRK